MPRSPEEFDDIHIVGVIEEEVGVPRNDGTRGSALYEVPVRLSAPAPAEWVRVFGEHIRGTLIPPPELSVIGDKLLLKRTTIEKAGALKSNLVAAVKVANREYEKFLVDRAQAAEREAARVEQHRRHIAEQVKKIKFDDPDQ